MEKFLKKANLIFQALILVISIHDSFEEKPKYYHEADVRVVVPAQNIFSLKLYRQLNEQDENLFFAPMSISTILALIYIGAEGNTKTQMQKNINFPEDKLVIMGAFNDLTDDYQTKHDYQLKSVVNMYISEKFAVRENYYSNLLKNFNTRAQTVDFGDRDDVIKEINKEVEYATNYKIRRLVSRGMISRDSKLIVINGIYFKGAWENPFSSSKTTTAPFYTSQDKSVNAKMMSQSAKFPFANIDELDSKILSMPYKGNDGRISFTIILPNRRDGLLNLGKKLSSIGDMTSLLNRTKEQTVDVKIPKFRVDSKIELPDAMKKIGIKDIFEEGKVDLSGIANNDKNKIMTLSNIIQKTFIDVDEDGTEAGGSTMAKMNFLSNRQASAKFIADRPFLFFIHDKISKQIMFLGNVKEI